MRERVIYLLATIWLQTLQAWKLSNPKLVTDLASELHKNYIVLHVPNLKSDETIQGFLTQTR